MLSEPHATFASVHREQVADGKNLDYTIGCPVSYTHLPSENENNELEERPVAICRLLCILPCHVVYTR